MLFLGATFAGRRLHERQPINSRGGVSIPCWAVSTRRCMFASASCCSCSWLGGFVIRGRGLIIPGCCGISQLPRGTTFATRSLHESHPTVNQSVGLASSHLGGWNRPGRHLLSTLSCSSCRWAAGVMIRGWAYRPWVPLYPQASADQ